MKVLGICGSPRTGGNTDLVLEEALRGAASRGAETRKLFLEKMDISPCREIEYNNITEEGLSVVKDDIYEVYKAISESDIIFVASPVFFGSISAQLKIMIDRFQSVWVAKNKMGKNIFSDSKKGAFFCIAAQNEERIFNNSREIVRHFFATINIKMEKELFITGIEGKGDILNRKDILESAYKAGKEMTE